MSERLTHLDLKMNELECIGETEWGDDRDGAHDPGSLAPMAENIVPVNKMESETQLQQRKRGVAVVSGSLSWL